MFHTWMMTLKFEANTHCIMIITNTLLCSKAVLFSFNLSLNCKLLVFIYSDLYFLLLTWIIPCLLLFIWILCLFLFIWIPFLFVLTWILSFYFLLEFVVYSYWNASFGRFWFSFEMKKLKELMEKIWIQH